MDDGRFSAISLAGIPTLKSRGRIALAIFTAALGGLLSMSQSLGGVACKPIITVKSVNFSDAQEMRRVWTAVLAVDAPRCANASGYFEIDFVRTKETGPDLQFTEPFEWRAGEVIVSLDLWWDEAVTDYRVGFIAPCVCKESPF